MLVVEHPSGGWGGGAGGCHCLNHAEEFQMTSEVLHHYFIGKPIRKCFHICKKI